MPEQSADERLVVDKLIAPRERIGRRLTVRRAEDVRDRGLDLRSHIRFGRGVDPVGVGVAKRTDCPGGEQPWERPARCDGVTTRIGGDVL